MGRINYARVVLGGLLAGLVINIGEFVLNVPILGEQWRIALEGLGRAEVGGGQIAWFIVWGFVLGVALEWLYAAIRPRWGPGPKTAICAGLVVWALVWVLGFGSTLVQGILPVKLVIISWIWGVVELPIAGLLGARFYAEEDDMS